MDTSAREANGHTSFVAWARIEGSNVTSGTVEYTELSDDLLGRHLIVYFSRGQMRIDAEEHAEIDLTKFATGTGPRNGRGNGFATVDHATARIE